MEVYFLTFQSAITQVYDFSETHIDYIFILPDVDFGYLTTPNNQYFIRTSKTSKLNKLVNQNRKTITTVYGRKYV